MRGGKAENRPGHSAGAVLKKGALPPCILRALNLPVCGFVNLSMNLPETSTFLTTGKKGVKRKKAEFPA